MSVIHLNIGSNIHPRRQYIAAAIDALRAEFSSSMVKVSTIVESEPWGFDSSNRFLNCGVMIDTPFVADPFDTLRIVQKIERKISGSHPHRNPDGSYADRPLDIDIIAVDRLIIPEKDQPNNNSELILPHPRAKLREFVMLPLAQLDPITAEWISNL